MPRHASLACRIRSPCEDQIRRRLERSSGATAPSAGSDEASRALASGRSTRYMVSASRGAIAAIGASAWVSTCCPVWQCDWQTLALSFDLCARSWHEGGAVSTFTCTTAAPDVATKGQACTAVTILAKITPSSTLAAIHRLRLKTCFRVNMRYMVPDLATRS